MIRAWLRAGLMKWAFGADPAPLLGDLRRAAAAVLSVRAEYRALSERLERLERLASAGVDPLAGDTLRGHDRPYLDTEGVLLCTDVDAPVSEVRPLNWTAADADAAADTVRCC